MSSLNHEKRKKRKRGRTRRRRRRTEGEAGNRAASGGPAKRRGAYQETKLFGVMASAGEPGLRGRSARPSPAFLRPAAAEISLKKPP